MTAPWPFPKALGLLAGMACGDALGAIVEGMRREDVRRIFGRIDRLLELQDVPWYQDHPDLVARHWRPAWVHTDDTQQGLCLLDAWLETGEITERDLAERLRRLFPCARGHGRGWRTLYRNMKSGVWPPAMRSNAGAGSAVRAPVLALTCAGDDGTAPLWLLERAVQQSRVTHDDDRAHLAAALMAAASWHALRVAPEPDDPAPLPTDLLARVADEIAQLSASGAAGWSSGEERMQLVDSVRELARLEAALPEDRTGKGFETGLEIVAAHAGAAAGPAGTGTSNFALETPLTALWAFVCHGSRTRDAVLAAVNLGGDTDSLAAMVGAMCGAVRGFDPDWWTCTRDEVVTVAPDDERARADHGPPLEWFLSLKVRWQLWHRARAVAGEPPGEPPDGFSWIVREEDRVWRPLEVVEEELTRLERAKRRQVRAYFGGRTSYRIDELPGEVQGVLRPERQRPRGSEPEDEAPDLDGVAIGLYLRGREVRPTDARRAIKLFRRALEIEPRLHRCHHDLVIALWLEGEGREALAACRAWRSVDAREAAAGAPAFLAFGEQLERKLQLRAAYTVYALSGELNPRSASAATALGRNALRRGKLEQAASFYGVALGLDGADREAACALAGFRSLGRYAVPSLPDWVDQPHEMTAGELLLMAAAMRESGSASEEVAAALRAAIDSDPLMAPAYTWLIPRLLELERWEAAVQSARTFLSLESGLPCEPAQAAVVVGEAMLGRREAALEALVEADGCASRVLGWTRAHREQARAEWLSGVVHERAGRAISAEIAYRRAASLDPSDEESAAAAARLERRREAETQRRSMQRVTLRVKEEDATRRSALREIEELIVIHWVMLALAVVVPLLMGSSRFALVLGGGAAIVLAWKYIQRHDLETLVR